MKHSKKILALVLSVAVVASIAAAGTLAWLSADGGTVTNSFNVGVDNPTVKIKLDEAPVDSETGKEVTGERVVKNDYNHVVPGALLDKDPKVTVLDDSTPCYVYMAVQNNMGTGTTYRVSEEQALGTGWSEVATPTNPDGTPANLGENVKLYVYSGSVTAESEIPALFEEVFVDPSLTEAPEGTILVKAYGIQSEGEGMSQEVATANAAAWFAGDGKFAPVTTPTTPETEVNEPAA